MRDHPFGKASPDVYPAISPRRRVHRFAMTDAMGELANALCEVLGATTVTDLSRLSGGASRDTFRFVADGRPLILQRQRDGDIRDMGIEADVIIFHPYDRWG